MEEEIRKNVIWIILDGMRAAKNNHEKDRFDSFDNTIRRGVFFHKVIAPAPSTMMSILSFITGSPCYAMLPDFFSIFTSNNKQNYLGIHTLDSNIMFDIKNYPTIFNNLNKKNIKTYISTYYPNLRIFMHRLGFLTKYNDIQKEAYFDSIELTNEEVFNLAKKIISARGKQEHFFLIIHYVARNGINYIFNNTIKFLDNQNFFNDGILLVCPDHGWYSETFEKHMVKINLQHDADAKAESIITMGGLIGSGIEPSVQTANIWGPDLLFTTLDLAGFLPKEIINKYKYGARSYSNEIRTGNSINTSGRIFRSDTRFAKQPGGNTILIKDDLIWRFDHTTGKSDIAKWKMDMIKGTKEIKIKNTSDIKSLDKELKEQFNKSQESCLASGKSILKKYNPLFALKSNLQGDLVHQFKGHTYKHTLGIEPKNARVLVFRSFSMNFFKEAADVLYKFFVPNKVDVICDTMSLSLVKSYGFRTFCYGKGMVRKDLLLKSFPELLRNSYDICLMGYNLYPLKDYANIFRIINILKVKYTYFINVNGCLYKVNDTKKVIKEINELNDIRERYIELFYKYGRGEVL